LDGSNYLSLNVNEGTTNITREITFSSSNPGDYLIFVNQAGVNCSGGCDRQLVIRNSDKKIYSRVWSNEVAEFSYLSSGINPFDGGSHRLVFTLGSSGKTKVYLDGIALPLVGGTNNRSTSDWNGGIPYIGGGQVEGGASSSFVGTIVGYKMWNKCRRHSRFRRNTCQPSYQCNF
jgi:hypothetical protein